MTATTVKGLPAIGDVLPGFGQILDMGEAGPSVVLLLDASTSTDPAFTTALLDPDTMALTAFRTFAILDAAKDDLTHR